jgi:uncharacterized protein (DUF58 family)
VATGSLNLDAELLRKLEFTVLKRLDGLLFGDYSGFFFGPSLDLAEVREYQPGDEVRRIDWNVTARTGQLHIRQYREEREVTAWLIVDLSRPMQFGTRQTLKSSLALEFAAVAAAIATRHGDRVGVIGFSEQGLSIVPPATGRNQALRIVQSLQGVPASPGQNGLKATPSFDSAPGSAPDLNTALDYAAKTLKRRALLWVVSDFTPGTWAGTLRQLAYRHDTIAVRVTDPAEHTLPKAGELRLRDLSTDRELWIDTTDPKVRQAFEALVLEREKTIEYTFRAAKVDTLALSTDQSLINPLMAFILRRKNQRGVA